MDLQKEVERNQAPAKKTMRTMYSGVPQHQQQQQQPSQGNIDYEAMMRKKEAELSRLKKGSNSYKVAVGRIRAECRKMAAEATRRAKEEKKKGDMRPALEEKKMKKRIEIEVKKRKEDEKVALDRKREEDAKNERMKANLEKILRVVERERERDHRGKEVEGREGGKDGSKETKGG